MAVTDRAAANGLESQRQTVSIGIADYAVTSSGTTLSTSGLGSCLGVALFDATAGVAGLLHVKRPSPAETEDTPAATFADRGIELLVEAMEREGAARHRIEAKLAGGSDMFGFSATGSDLGTRNVEQAEATLSNLGIPVTARDVGGDHGRSLQFDGDSGVLTVESADRYCEAI